MVHYIYLGILLGCWDHTIDWVWWYCPCILLAGFNCGLIQIVYVRSFCIDRLYTNVSDSCSSKFARQKNRDFSIKSKKRLNSLKATSKNRKVFEKKGKRWYFDHISRKDSFYSITAYYFVEKVSSIVLFSKIKNFTIF